MMVQDGLHEHNENYVATNCMSSATRSDRNGNATNSFTKSYQTQFA